MAEVERILSALGCPEKTTRTHAESELFQVETCQSFMVSLLGIAKDQHRSLAIRQLSLTVVKNTVRNRWEDLSTETQNLLVKELIGVGLVTNRSLRNLAQASVALAVNRKGPNQCSELVSEICAGISSPSYPLDARLYLLELLLEIIQENGGARLSLYVVPISQSLLQSCINSPSSLVRKSSNVFTELMIQLYLDEEISSISISEWIPVFTDMAQSREMVDIINVLGNSKRILQHESDERFISFLFVLIVGAIEWLENSKEVYTSLYVLGEEGGIEEDDEAGGLETLVISICELINALALHDRGHLVLSQVLSRFLTAMLPYLQISILSEQEWFSNPNEYIANEQDDFASVTIRLAFEGLVADLLENPFLAHHATEGMLRASIKTIEEGVAARSVGNDEWWRLVEAGLFVFGFLGSENAKNYPETSVQILQGCAQFCQKSFSDLPFLRARAFTVLFRTHVLTAQCFPGDLLVILKCSAKAVSDENISVAFSASSVFTAFLSHCVEQKKGAVCDVLVGENGVVRAFLRLAKGGCDQTIHFSLEGLTAVFKHCPEAARQVWQDISDDLPNILEIKVDDPIAPQQILETVGFLQRALSTIEFDKLADALAGKFIDWIRVEAENRLEIALEFIELLVQHTSVPYSGSLLHCILRLNTKQLGETGLETTRTIDNILRVCVIRSPGFSVEPI